MQPRSIFHKNHQHLQIVQYQKFNTASENKEIKLFWTKVREHESSKRYWKCFYWGVDDTHRNKCSLCLCKSSLQTVWDRMNESRDVYVLTHTGGVEIEIFYAKKILTVFWKFEMLRRLPVRLWWWWVNEKWVNF